MSRPKNPSHHIPAGRRGAPPDDEVFADLGSSPRAMTGFMSSGFIRRMTVKPAATFSSESTRSHHRRRLSFSGEFGDGVGPHGLICVHSPEEPLVDIVFVHGLHGGSFKTWRKKDERGYFWPGEWLANDSEFQNVRIHTFGYAADWNTFKASNANVADFGSSLYGALLSSAHLNRGHKTPIILVGHSMGGLVIKRACLNAHRKKTFEEALDGNESSLKNRIKCLMFLGTPHHGSDSAERLDKLLKSGLAPMSQKEYVKELRRESPSNEAINDDFRFIADSFTLFSFFEARPTAGLGFVVDKDSARIVVSFGSEDYLGGSPHEHTQPLDADHRGMVKFDSIEDNNYRIIHDHLLVVVDALIGFENEREPDKLEPLDVYLDCEESHDDVFESILENRADGTCQWIKHRQGFIPWTQDGGPPVWLYWLHAPPGTGKSVMSVSVIQMLQEKQRDVSYFFFVSGNKYHRTVAGMLRFMAFQMAQKHPRVEEAIEDMQRTGVQWDEADDKVIWKKLFVNCIFKLPLGRVQYWVIDALDEGADSHKLWPLFKSVHAKFNLRVFLTSRPSADIRTSFLAVNNSIQCTEDTISPEDTQNDIRILVEEKGFAIPGDSEEDKKAMLDKIVEHSQGSFLWTNHVLTEMESVYDQSDIDGILDEVPLEMVKHYEAIFKQMAAKGDKNHALIHAMLIWATCCVRALSKDEFQRALLLDIGKKIAVPIQRAVEGLCSQLLTVNKHGAVHVVHSTVQEILLDRNYKFPYSIRREEGHRRLALACLEFLNSAEMKPDSRLISLTETKLGHSIVQRASPFADYATTAFSAHLVNSPPDDEKLFAQLVKFLRSPNALVWINYVAEKHQSLQHIREAGTNLQRFMQKRAKHVAPVEPGVPLLADWSTDLLRVVSKFGRNILDSPSQILLLVPAICPRNSIIHKLFRDWNPSFRITGIADDFWADAISYIEHLGAKPSAISLGARYLAVGKQSGQILIYDNETWEELLELAHGEPITALKFSNSGSYVVASGSTTIKLWNLEHTNPSPGPVRIVDVKHPSTAFFFSDDDETVITVSGQSILRIAVADDDEEENEDSTPPEEVPFQPSANGDGAFDDNTLVRSVSFSPDGQFVAFTYDNHPISIWSVASGNHLGFCDRRSGHDASEAEVERLLFNPNPDFAFIVVTYKQGELVLFDYEHLKEDKSVKAEPFALACSPDGHTLVTGDAKGKIQLWDFEMLTLLYVINYHSTAVRDLRFSKDGLRLIDLRESHSVIWEPAALIRNNDEEETSSVGGTSVAYRQPVQVDDYDDKAQISCFLIHPVKPIAIVGKEDGLVDTYNLDTGNRVGELFTLKPSRPTHFALHKDGLLACACSENTVSVSLLADDGDSVKQEEVLLQVDDFGEKILQVIFSKSGECLLVCGPSRTQVWRRGSGATSFRPLAPSASPTGGCWRYMACNDDVDSFQLIDKKLEDLVRGADAGLPGKLRRTNTWESDKDPATRIRNVLVDDHTGYLIVEYEGALATRQLVILQQLPGPASPEPSKLSPPMDGFSPPVPTPSVTDQYRVLLHLKPYQIKMFLGLYDGKAVYLGPRLWVRTCDLHHLVWGQKPVKRRHFFVPHEYIGGSYHVQAMVGHEGEVAFPRRGELAVVHRGIIS